MSNNFDDRRIIRRPELIGSLPSVALSLGLIALILWTLRDYAKSKDNIFQNVYSGVVSSLIWTCVIIAIVIAVSASVNFQKRRRTIAFFGLKNVDSKLSIFLSNIQIQKNATIALEEVNPGYWGCAVSRLEYQAAHAIRAIITSKPLSPIPSNDAEDWLGRINQKFGMTEVDIRVSPIPNGLRPMSKEPLASFQVSENAQIKVEKSEKVLTEDGSYKDSEMKVTIALNSSDGVTNKDGQDVVSITANRDTSKIITEGKEGEIVSDKDNPRKSVYYRWDEDIRNKEDFWTAELKDCGSIVVIGSDIYNSVARYYSDVFYEKNISDYRYFAMFESKTEDKDRRVVIREVGGQKKEGSKYSGKTFYTDDRGEPAIIMRIKEKNIQERESITYEHRTVILCAGLTSTATASAVHYLCGKWQHLYAHFKDREFAVVLYCRKREDEPTDIRQIEAGRFIESYELKPSREPGVE